MEAFDALKNGTGQALRRPQLLIISYGFMLLAAGLLTVLPALNLIGPARNTAIQDAADGLDAWFVLEILESPITYSALTGSSSQATPPGFDQFILMGCFLFLAIPIAAWVPASFLSGGILLAYTEDSLGWRRFCWGCWHWFGSFLLLNALQGCAATLLFGGLLAGAYALGSAIGGWLNWITLPLIVLLALLWLAIFESTRVLAVAGSTRNVFKTLLDAIRLVFSRPLTFFGVYLAFFLILLLTHGVFRLGLMPNLPLAWWPLVFVVTQAFILLRLGIRLARWSSLAKLVQNSTAI